MIIRVYIFISFILNLFFPTISSPALATAVNKYEADVVVEISELNGLEIGSKVLNKGIIVGKVNFVRKLEKNSAHVGVDLNHKILKSLPSGTIGLVKSPMTVDPANRQTLLEFFNPLDTSSTKIKRGSTIKGFSSFEEFWKADLGKASDSYETTSIT